MLNKEICIRCINKHGYKLDGYTDLSNDWNEYDDYRWDEGKIFCPHKLNICSSGISYTNEIIDHCPYSLEHIMKEQ